MLCKQAILSNNKEIFFYVVDQLTFSPTQLNSISDFILQQASFDLIKSCFKSDNININMGLKKTVYLFKRDDINIIELFLNEYQEFFKLPAINQYINNYYSPILKILENKKKINNF